MLAVVDHFSKMTHFIALPKLPSAKETAEVMMNQVFRIHGFPKDIVSDRGPQFVSRFWREFCRLIVAKVSLTSSYHPEANGTDRAPKPTAGNPPPMFAVPLGAHYWSGSSMPIILCLPLLLVCPHFNVYMVSRL